MLSGSLRPPDRLIASGSGPAYADPLVAAQLPPHPRWALGTRCAHWGGLPHHKTDVTGHQRPEGLDIFTRLCCRCGPPSCRTAGPSVQGPRPLLPGLCTLWLQSRGLGLCGARVEGRILGIDQRGGTPWDTIGTTYRTSTSIPELEGPTRC